MRLCVSLLTLTLAICAVGAPADVSVTHMVGFDYPVLAHTAGVQGTLRLSLQIEEDGRVGSVRVLDGNPLLVVGDPLKTLKEWRFTPCKGSTADCIYLVFVEFVLQGGPLDFPKCKTRFEFDAPDRIRVRSEFVKTEAAGGR